MNIKKYPQYDLYRLTKLLAHNKEKLIPKGADIRCINSTIVNRCYYSSYLYAAEWLLDKKHLAAKNIHDMPENQFMTEHAQVKNFLRNVNKFSSSKKLNELSNLRKKADYEPFSYLSEEEVSKSLELMDDIFKDLNF